MVYFENAIESLYNLEEGRFDREDEGNIDFDNSLFYFDTTAFNP